MSNVSELIVQENTSLSQEEKHKELLQELGLNNHVTKLISRQAQERARHAGYTEYTLQGLCQWAVELFGYKKCKFSIHRQRKRGYLIYLEPKWFKPSVWFGLRPVEVLKEPLPYAVALKLQEVKTAKLFDQYLVFAPQDAFEKPIAPDPILVGVIGDKFYPICIWGRQAS